MLSFKFESFPHLVRQCAVQAIGWRNRLTRYGREYHAWSRLLDETADWLPPKREAWQVARLLQLLDSAHRGTRHYAVSDFNPKQFRPTTPLQSILQTLPMLDKATLRAYPAAFENRNVYQSSTTRTSGSTGAPMCFGHDAKSIQRRFAFVHDHIRTAGVDPSEPSVRLSGRIFCEVGVRQSKPWMLNGAENQLFLSSYHLDEAHTDCICNCMQRFRPVLLDGYPSGILELLRLLERRKCRLPNLQAVITTAETLEDDSRSEIAERTGVPVLDYYSASEGIPFIQQCPFGTYHVRWQSGIVEVDSGQTVGPEGDGELVCTSFVQDRTPLIRYRTGDLVQKLRTDSSVPCPCGSQTPVVDRVVGRVEDVVSTPDGRSIGMFTYRTLKNMQGLGETQVVQLGFAEFEVNSTLQPGADVAKLTSAVKASFERALGYPISLRLKKVDRLPRGPGGKVRLVSSHVRRSS